MSSSPHFPSSSFSPELAHSTSRIPPLRSGDHLSVGEYERRYSAMPEETMAELIDGVVYISSPVNAAYHGEPNASLAGVLGIYSFHTPGVQGGCHSTLKGIPGRNQPQPDILLRIQSEFGGRTRHDEEGFLVGIPELVAEIAYSSVSYDLHVKKNVYRRNGLLEYLVWRTEDRAIDWFILRGDQYELLRPDSEGILTSEALPGLWLDPAALLGEIFPRVLEVLQRGIASPEHQAFVQKLQDRKSTK